MKKIQLEITLSMLEAENKSLRDQLRTAEQERDQYKEKLEHALVAWEVRREQAKEQQQELESLRAKIKEAQGKPKIDFSFVQDCLITYKSQIYFDGAEGLRDKIQGQIDLLSVIPD